MNAHEDYDQSCSFEAEWLRSERVQLRHVMCRYGLENGGTRG